jgi:hypothetical protein
VSRGETVWRWALRVGGLAAFGVCLFIGVILQQPVPVLYLVVAAGMMGLDSIQGFEVRRRERDGK